MSEAPAAPKKRGRPRKVVPPKEDASGEISQEKPAKRGRKAATKENVVEGVKEKKSRAKKTTVAAKIEEKETETALESKSIAQHVSSLDSQLQSIALEHSKILKEVAAIATINTIAKSVISPQAVLPSLPNVSPSHSLTMPPPNFTSSPILQQAAALSAKSEAKPSSTGPAKITKTTKKYSTSKTSSTVAKPTTPGARSATTTKSSAISTPKTTSSSKTAAPGAKSTMTVRSSTSTSKAAATKSALKTTATSPKSSPAPSTSYPKKSTPITPSIPKAEATPSTSPAAQPSLSSKMAEANKVAVSQLSARPGPGRGARTTRESAAAVMGTAHPQYKKRARSLLMLMVSAPIAIVLSYHVYQRVVLGKEPKILPKNWQEIPSGVSLYRIMSGAKNSEQKQPSDENAEEKRTESAGSA